MCCRYGMSQALEMREIMEQINRSPLLRLGNVSVLSSGEARPTDVVPAVASNRSGKRAAFPMKWGFAGRTLLINARSETASALPTFREAWAGHRCAVPADCYFEWEHREGSRRAGQKFRIHPREGGLTWLCGLYRMENGFPSFVILTRAPGESVRFIHDRMPLILPEDAVSAWIRPDADPAGLLRCALTEMAFEPVS